MMISIFFLGVSVGALICYVIHAVLTWNTDREMSKERKQSLIDFEKDLRKIAMRYTPKSIIKE